MADRHPTYSGHETHARANGHSSSFVRYLTDEKGSTVCLIICEDCHFIEAQCEHVKCSWNQAGTTLTCDFCQIDGT